MVWCHQQQAISRAIVDPDQGGHIVCLGYNELMLTLKTNVIVD